MNYERDNSEGRHGVDDRTRLFRSKAETLSVLRAYDELHIPEFFVFSYAEWRSGQDRILRQAAGFAPSLVAVRSSCLREDGADQSGAGAFTSKLNVSAEDPDALRAAVCSVFDSYGDISPGDQAFIQRMVPDVRVSGVIMTRVPASGAPYYTVNYDDESGKTDTVTGGTGVSKTVYIVKSARESDFDSKRLSFYVSLARTVERICENDALDLEFCQDGAGVVHLLQVRPLCTKAHWITAVDNLVHDNIGFAKKFVAKRMLPATGLYGSHTILGVMPDWNPAEMIGVTPRPLAASLYRELITRDVWREARARMGYRELPPVELMVLIGGRPFIDVRASFNSFLPRQLDASTGEALIAAWLQRLDQNPHLHDKVEFEVAQTAFDFCFEQDLEDRCPGVLASDRRRGFAERLRWLTLECLDSGPDGTLSNAFAAIEELRRRQSGVPLPRRDQLSPDDHCGILSFVEMLLDECRKYGTLPFSVIARHAFIAESLLKTAVRRGALEPERLAAFKNSIQTVAGEMAHAVRAVSQGNMTPQLFMERYGHLRPGSYDILSPRYVDRIGFWGNAPSAFEPEISSFAFTASERHALTKLLLEAKFTGVSVEHVERYARLAIAGRENAKFVFSRHLSDILEYLGAWGFGLGLSDDALSFLSVQDILSGNMQTILCDEREHYAHLSSRGRTLFDLARSLKLGYIIRSERDVSVVPQHRSAPNFVGNVDIEKKVAVLSATGHCDVELTDCIVCIENADPGFDWIFTRNIAGLVTMFGGVNSHMAIRCAEYGLPAAIGIGEQLFMQISAAPRCRLNAGGCSLHALE